MSEQTPLISKEDGQCNELETTGNHEQTSNPLVGQNAKTGDGLINLPEEGNQNCFEIEDSDETTPIRKEEKVDFVAYLICGMTVLMLAFVRGTALSFGEFLREMEAEFCIGNCKKKLGWVESISVGLNGMCGPISLFILSKGGIVSTFTLGLTLCSCGLLASSFVSHLNYLFGTYSCLFGLGTSLIYYPPFTVLSAEFPSGHPHRVLTTALISLGSPLGIFIINPVAAKLNHVFGWRTAFRILSAMIAGFGLLCLIVLVIKCYKTLPCFYCVVSNPEEKTNEDSNYQNLNSKQTVQRTCFVFWRKWSTTFWVLSQFTSHVAYYIPHVFMVPFVRSKMNEPAVTSSMVMSTLGGSEAASRLFFAFMSPKLVGHFLFLEAFAIGILGVCAALEVFAYMFWHVLAYCLMQGILGGFFKATSYPLVLDFDMPQAETKMVWSAGNFLMGFAMLVGPPICGSLHDTYNSYQPMFVLSAVFILLTSVLLFVGLKLHHAEQAQLANDSDSESGDYAQ